MPLKSNPMFCTLMDRKRFAGVFIMVVLLGVAAGARPNNLRDKEIEVQLASLNKPAVKTIMSEDTNIIDCVDIYKQPAFDHPLLKNHTIEMRPSFIPRVEKSKNVHGAQTQQTWQKSGTCPEGTIPIQRIRETDLLRAGSLNNNAVGIQEFNECEVDVARLELHAGGPYIAAQGIINLWKPSVKADEWSVSSVAMFNVNDSFIETGWAVIPSFYGDNSPRLFTRWTDTTNGKGCFNLRCPGFVQTSSHYLLGGKFEPLSQLDGDQYEITSVIYKDVTKGNWWVTVEGESVGYWPSQLITEFEELPRINWGGSICNKAGKGIIGRFLHTTTEMGSGHHAMEMFRRASYVRNILVMGLDKQLVVPLVPKMELSQPTEDCYSVASAAYDGRDVKPGPAFYYGGPGGRFCNVSSGGGK